MTEKREAVLLMTHFVDETIIALYRRPAAESGGRDVFILLNQTDNPDPDKPIPEDVAVFAFTVDDLRRLNYPLKGRRIRDKDIELFSFTFWKANPGYDRIWVVEYDVVYTGYWHEVFNAFADNDAGLLATSIHRHDVNPTWPNWPSIRLPKGEVDLSTMIRAFMPLYRLSNVAYLALDRAYAQGWEGFYEGIVPAILLQAGLSIEDIGGDGEFVKSENRNRFYTSTPAANELSPGTFVFRPVHVEAGPQPGRLWHPVKPQSHPVGWPIKRRQQLVHRARILAARGASSLSRLLAP